MPIRFRCPYCSKLLGIARRKAGTETLCPHCGYEITVPLELEQNDQEGSDPVPPLPVVPASATVPVSPPLPNAKPTPPQPVALAPPVPPANPANAVTSAAPEVATGVEPPATIPDSDPPLFERDVDEMLGVKAAPAVAEKPNPGPTSGMDAMSLANLGGPVVLSPQKATVIVVGVMLLLAFAFAAGFLIASR